MNIDDNFRYVGNANIEPMKALVSELTSDEWESEEPWSQGNEAYRDTQAIPLVYDEDFRHTDPTKRPALQIFEPVMRPLLAVTADFYDESSQGRELTKKFGTGYFIRASLVRLLPSRTISEHRDMNFSLAHAHRVHVLIVTNDQARFTVGGETLGIPEGEIYEINNRRAHAVRNEGDEPCVHLILDYVLKGEQCCCGEKRHPDAPCTPAACLDTVTGRIPCTCLPENH